jgi:uncharacterized protein (DUF2141 family)
LNTSKLIFSFFLFVAFLLSCAKTGTPPGGEKDEDPPIALKSSPENYKTSYDQKNIKITFDEFIKFNDVYNEFTVSPPLEEKPTPSIRGKKIFVEFPSSELDSFTYTLDFGQAVQDYHEGNTLPNFQFVVTKMPYIDSFSVKGVVLDAFTKLPDEEMLFVELNRDFSDTAFQTIKPAYIARTNPKGEFLINHVAPGTYNVFALKDANNNMLFDMPSEAIAFSDEPIILHPDSFPDIPQHPMEMDSAFFDSLAVPDSVPPFLPMSDTMADSIHVADSMQLMTYGYSFNLYTFEEADEFNLYLDDYNRDTKEKLSFLFTENLEHAPELRLLEPDTTGKWFYLEDNPTHDTVHYWLADSNLVSKDSIVVEAKYPETDTTGALITKIDTLVFSFLEKKKSEDKKDKDKKGGLLSRLTGKSDTTEVDTVAPVYRFSIKSNAKSSEHDLNVPVLITTETPVFSYHPELFEAVMMDDTIERPILATLEPDTNNFRKFRVNLKIEPNTTYILKLNEGVLTDIYNRTIDSTEIRFTTQKDDYYGTVNMDVTNIEEPALVQLLNEKEEVQRSYKIYKSQKLTFKYLHPGKYILKVIYDENDNGKWDTGKYSDRIQPEHVEYFPKMLEVRSNWEVEYVWELIDAISTTRPQEEKAEEGEGGGPQSKDKGPSKGSKGKSGSN